MRRSAVLPMNSCSEISCRKPWPRVHQPLTCLRRLGHTWADVGLLRLGFAASRQRVQPGPGARRRVHAGGPSDSHRSRACRTPSPALASRPAGLGRPISALGARDTALAGALLALSKDDHSSACTRWRTMTERWPNEFAAWYGSAICQSMDGSRPKDAASPSHWAFRSSYHQAQLAWRTGVYTDARDIPGLPGRRRPNWPENPVDFDQSTARGVRDSSRHWRVFGLSVVAGRYHRLHTLSATGLRRGEGAGGDPNDLEAIRQQRKAFYDLASEWQSTNRHNPDAAEALIGCRVARRVQRRRHNSGPSPVRRAQDRARLGVTEALMLVLLGVPEEAKLLRARSLIDSLLGSGRTSEDSTPGTWPQWLRSLGALNLRPV